MNKLLKAKPKSAASHNKAMPDVMDKVKAKDDVPFQVRLPENLVKAVAVFKANSGLTHKAIVMEALEGYLKIKG